MGVETNKELSLPVPCVQELASQQLDTVPDRYIRDDLDNIAVTVPSGDVPLIDMNKLANPESQHTEIQKLDDALKHWGVFQLVNHGVSDEVLRSMKKHAQEFFDLPLEEKKHWAQKPGSLEGYGQAFVEEQKLQWNDMFFLITLPIESRNLEFWPENPPKFRESLDRYSLDLRKVAAALARFIAIGLGIDKSQELYNAYQEGEHHTKMNYYPPCSQPERVIGATPHMDVPGFTLLLDCGHIAGLQVLKDDNWVFVEPIDGAIIVNLGHITEIMSNGKYKAPEHRAVINKSKERLSIATFCYPKLSFNVGPAKELVKPGISPPLYKTVTVEEYFHCFLNRKPEISFIDSLKI